MSQTLFTAQQRAELCVLSLEQAVYHACKAKRGTLGEIAEVYGVNYNTLALQVNPNRTCHTLAPETIEFVLEHAPNEGKALIMDAICCAHGNAGWFLLPDANDDGEVMTDIGELGKKFGDTLATMLDAYADQVITADEYKAIEKVAHALQRQIQTILENAKRNMESHNDK